ncbi:uncharacterized protein LOC112043030 [Bicyclus anynana]|uniref:Uncharacterized protein LOC112043030 n=1 Tax=Bicyclus anynana TaxID=110368 RepID=A0A6J1MMM9_BICAN|nr:uncharacterized protein LOC112043030 [Bicyclus anynana]
MTSRVDAPKTNEFLRRRKLRLQQVREQSKDIARKIRQRANVETLRQLDSVDAKKEQEYLDCQEKLVKHLELLYSKGLQNVGVSHKEALEVTDQDCIKKTDLSKLRGKEATEVLRKKKQEKLDEQKKLLDRKLQARETANEISREKSAAVSKNLTKQLPKKCENIPSKPIIPTTDAINQIQDSKQDNINVAKNDMGTQWESEEIPNEWIPNVPILSLPKDDSVKESLVPNTEKSDKRLNLFALSDEMPSSLRGGFTGHTEAPAPAKPALTLVSEYLQNRNLRLRHTEPSSSKKTDDLQSIKQTILRTRAARPDANKDKTSVSTEANTGLSRKKSVTVYNHNTRNIQDLPCSDDKIVTRDTRAEDDAYAQALKETTIANSLEKEQLSKQLKDMRTKVAVNKNNVDKEYKDTIAFLNSIAKHRSEKPIKSAYLDEHRQEQQNERHQRKLQEEFKKIERECNKHNCKHGKRKSTLAENKRNKSRSPIQREMRQDFEYSWMPVPESDGNLAVHTIPNNNTKNKSGNTVKFSKNDSYHEYRSRHKHTPPTKDVSNDRQNKRVVETVILQESIDSDVNESSVVSETSSVENLNLEKDKNNDDPRLKDAERIIIYKILESKKDKKNKEHKKCKTTRFANTSTDEVKTKVSGSTVKEDDKKQRTSDIENSGGDIQRAVSFEQLQEGVYEAMNSDGDNITSMYFSEGNKRAEVKSNTPGPCCCCSKNIDTRCGGYTLTRLIQEDSKSSYCKCGCKKKKENVNLDQPSAATSTTSFTTALNNKTSNPLPDSGFVKLIEEGTQDSNTFYVGASGFLKDDNYEVVIQLRKKDTEKANSITTKQSESDTKHVNPSDIQEIVQNILDNVPSNKNLNEGSTLPLRVATNVDANKTLHESVNEQIVEKQHMEVEMPQESNLDSQFKNVCEKAVLTSFHDDFAYSATVSKTDSVSRPGTSTYTQTSFNSSVPRPVFMHLSSTTSTAYMSPPELILPKFLKQNYVVTREELYESENTMNHLDSNFDVLESDHCAELNNCRLRVSEKYPLNTPPNTARSRSKEDVRDGTERKKRKCICHKCRSHSDTNVYHKTNGKRRNAFKTKSSKDLPSENGYAMLKQSPKKIIANTHSSNKANHKINPIVKEYVNKLLDLNSEGLKAIKVINQDCSAVATPCSSIINLSCNRNKDKSTVESKISLEQIKNILKQQILNDDIKAKPSVIKINRNSDTEKISIPTKTQNSYKLLKRKSMHKVRSLNISKHILKKKKLSDTNISKRQSRKTAASVCLSAREENKLPRTERRGIVNRSKSSSTPRKCTYSEYKNSTSSDIVESSNGKKCNSSGINPQEIMNNKPVKSAKCVKSQQKKKSHLPTYRSTRASFSSDSGTYGAVFRHLRPPEPPVHISTQTNGIIDTEIHFMKVAENKLQNMEKIADLTEKCTKRLSNLAKVLEEVRRNKSLVYGQISTSDSAPESEQKPEKNEMSTEISGHTSEHNILTRSTENVHNVPSLTMPEKLDDQFVYVKDSTDFTPFLKDIPKPDVSTSPPCYAGLEITDKSTNAHQESENTKSRGRPPPALSRIHLKGKHDVINITPHELSTVVEVDSPMSIRLKNQPSRQDSMTRLEVLEKSDDVLNDNNKCVTTVNGTTDKKHVDPDLLKSNISKTKRLSKVSSTDSSDDSKLKMMNMKTFNDIMLKPFISLKEYAKQCNIGLDEGSNLEDLLKDDPINDDLSSLHSDGSLPDVIAELLKRNVISEPFKFDTGSNVNSTVSSESTLSVLALSKARKEKKKSGMLLKNKENIIETSETLSLSSNPDLENAFQKLGMGWASSTLKKTKERLALSSSSNTSSSSMTKFKIKSFSQDLPNLASDSTSSFMEVSNKRKMSSPGKYNVAEISRNAVQQTSLTNSMTVKEFLTNELAKKITFNNKSTRKGEEEFISLYETKMPEQMKHTNVELEEENSIANQNRARTSTPVQIFKSNTYHSTSTSNTSNGFFSNADDLSSVKVTSSIRNHSTSDKDDLTIPNYSLKTKKGQSDCSKSE